MPDTVYPIDAHEDGHRRTDLFLVFAFGSSGDVLHETNA